MVIVEKLVEFMNACAMESGDCDPILEIKLTNIAFETLVKEISPGLIKKADKARMLTVEGIKIVRDEDEWIHKKIHS